MADYQTHTSLALVPGARAPDAGGEPGSWMILGGALLAHGDGAGARALVDQALARAVTSPAAAEAIAHACLRTTEADLANLHPGEAAALLARVIDVCVRSLGDIHPATTALRCRLGDVLHAEGELAQARQQYDAVLAVHRANAHGDSDAIAWALSGMGDILRAERQYSIALMYLRRALRRQLDTLGAHPATARTHTRLGALWFDQGRYNEARAHFEQALAIREEALGPRDPGTAQSLHNLGLTLAALGDARSARVCLAQALAIREDRLGREHLATAHSLEALSRVLTELGDEESAQYCLERAVALYHARLGEQHPVSSAAAMRLRKNRRGARWRSIFGSDT